MGRRVTIVIEDDLYKKLRERQAKLIRETEGPVSFSKVINQSVRKRIK